MNGRVRACGSGCRSGFSRDGLDRPSRLKPLPQRLACALLAGAVFTCAAGDLPRDLRASAKAVAENAEKENRAYAIVESLVTEVGPRFAGTEGDRRAVAWAQVKLKELGFQNVRAEPVTVPRWERGDIRVRMTAPYPQDFAAAALGGSVGAGKKGVEAPVIAVNSLEELEWLPDTAVRDRIVFFNTRMERSKDGSGYGKAVLSRYRGATRAGRKGAAGVVIRSIGTDEHRSPHTGAMTYEPGAAKVPAAALSAADADLLERSLASGPVKLHMQLGARDRGEAQSANVIGEIPGETDEIVLVVAHLDSWDITPGANDDGAGVGIAMEAARLAAAGRKPRRTLRVLLTANEEFGLSGAKAYAEAHAAELPRHTVAMEADSGSGRAYRLDTRLPAASLRLIEDLADALDLEPGSNDADGGADLGGLRKKGVPVFDLQQDASGYFDVHHTADDTLDKISRAGLSQATGVFAALVHVASEHGPGLGRLSEKEGQATTLSWKGLNERPQPPPGQRIAYGSGEQQFGELRVPEGRGPFPVAIVLHGGCWLNAFDYRYMTGLSAALAGSGLAAWTPEYRRVGDKGGGWPGTFLDAAAAADHLRELAQKYPLDLKRVITIGHSAGGQLALWLAARAQMPAGSELHSENPLRIAGVIGLAAITDLRRYSEGPEQSCHAGARQVMGGTPIEVPARYAQVSPMDLAPLKIPVRLLQGAADSIVPVEQAQAYAAKGGDIKLALLDDAGHFEPVSLHAATWATVIARARELSKTAGN